MELNPLTTEIHEACKVLIAPDNTEATVERMGGQEVVDQMVVMLRNSCVVQTPEIAILGALGLKVVEVALFTGMVAGVAAEQRARAGDELLREWGVE